MWTCGSTFSRNPLLLKHRDDALARLEAVEVVEAKHGIEIGAAIQSFEKRVVAGKLQPRFRTHDVDGAEPVPLADLEIVEVVRRGDLDGAGAFLRVRVFVGDDRDAAPDERQDGMLADEVAKALVVRVHRDAGVAEHGLGPRRRDRDEAPLAGPRSGSGCARAGP